MRAPEPWIGDEPRFWVVLREVLRRAARRPVWTLAAAVSATLAILGIRLARPPSYTATVTFRLAEGSVEAPVGTSRAAADLRDAVTTTLNRAQLLALMERQGIAKQLRQLDPVGAVDSMREDIEVGVDRNYFVLDREAAGGPRSALVTVSFTGDDRAQVEAVAHDIGAIVVESQAAARAAHLDRARQWYAAQSREQRERIREIREQRARVAERQLRRNGPDPGSLAEAASLEDELESWSSRADAVSRRAEDFELADEADDERLVSDYELVDESVTVVRDRLTKRRALAYASPLFAFVILPISAALVGAFDQRIYRAADLTTRGIPLLGVVPAPSAGRARSSDARGGRAQPGAPA